MQLQCVVIALLVKRRRNLQTMIALNRKENLVPEAVVSAAMTKAAIEVVGNASKPLLKKIAARLSIEIDRLNVQFLKTFEDELAKA